MKQLKEKEQKQLKEKEQLKEHVKEQKQLKEKEQLKGKKKFIEGNMVKKSCDKI